NKSSHPQNANCRATRDSWSKRSAVNFGSQAFPCRYSRYARCDSSPQSAATNRGAPVVRCEKKRRGESSTDRIRQSRGVRWGRGSIGDGQVGNLPPRGPRPITAADGGAANESARHPLHAGLRPPADHPGKWAEITPCLGVVADGLLPVGLTGSILHFRRVVVTSAADIFHKFAQKHGRIAPGRQGEAHAHAFGLTDR